MAGVPTAVAWLTRTAKGEGGLSRLRPRSLGGGRWWKAMLLFSMRIAGAAVESPGLYPYRINMPGMRFEFHDDHVEIKVPGNTVTVPLDSITSVEARRGLPFFTGVIKLNRQPLNNTLAFGSYSKRNVEEVISLFREKNVAVSIGGFYL